MNIAYEDDELKPYIEPESDLSDGRRIEVLTSMGYIKDEIEESLRSRKYDDIMANYLLLGKRASDVILSNFINYNNYHNLIDYRMNKVILVQVQVYHLEVYDLEGLMLRQIASHLLILKCSEVFLQLQNQEDLAMGVIRTHKMQAVFPRGHRQQLLIKDKIL